MTVAPSNAVTLDKPGETPRDSRVSTLHWALLWIGSFALYLLSATPNIQWQDSGEFVLRVMRGEYLDPQGLCRAHPLHFLLCRLAIKIFPNSIPMACSAVSALGGSIAVANVYGIVRTLTGYSKAALLAAFGLLVAHSFWRFSCFIEVYSLTTALLTAETWCLVKWDRTRKPGWLVAMFFFNGLGLANHDLAMLSLPAIGIVFLVAWAQRQATFKSAVLGLLAWLIGSSIYLMLVVRDARESGLAHAIRSATVGDFGALVEGKALVLLYTAMTIAFTLLSFPNLMLPAALLGIVRGRRAGIGPISYYAILGSMFMHAVFVLRYNVIDQYTFAIPSYALLAVVSGLGFAVVQATWTANLRKWALGVAAALLVLTPLTYIATTAVARYFHALRYLARNKPYRDDYRFFLIPWARGEDSANHMSRRARDFAGEHGLIVEPVATQSFTIEYQLQMRNWPADGLIPYMGMDRIAAHVKAHQPVVYVPYNVGQMPPEVPYGKWRRVEDLYVLQPNVDVSPATQKAP